MKRQTYPYADWIHWFAFWFLKNRHPRLKPSPEPTLTIPSWTVMLGQCVITTERQAKTRKTLLITLRHSHTTLSVVYAFHSVSHHGPATRFSKCFVLHCQSTQFLDQYFYIYIYINTSISTASWILYETIVLTSFTVIFCFRFAILYHIFSYNIKIDTCIFLL